MSNMKNYMKLDDMETIHFKLTPAQIAAFADIYEEGVLLWLHASAKQGFTLAMKELSDRLCEVDPKMSKKWLRRYYRKKDTIETLHGKKYMKSIRKMRMPEVIDGEVVIRI